MGVLLGQERSVIRSIIRLLDMDWVVDIVDLSLGLDNRGVDSLDSNGKMGSSWLVDLGGISGNIAGLSIVNLLGDNWCGLVNGGDSGSLFSNGVRCWGSGLGIGYRSVGNNRASRVVLGSIGNWCGSDSWGSSNSNCGSSSSDSDSRITDEVERHLRIIHELESSFKNSTPCTNENDKVERNESDLELDFDALGSQSSRFIVSSKVRSMMTMSKNLLISKNLAIA